MNSIPKTNDLSTSMLNVNVDPNDIIRSRIMKTIDLDYRFENLNHLKFNSYSKPINDHIRTVIQQRPSI